MTYTEAALCWSAETLPKLHGEGEAARRGGETLGLWRQGALRGREHGDGAVAEGELAQGVVVVGLLVGPPHGLRPRVRDLFVLMWGGREWGGGSGLEETCFKQNPN